MRYESLVEKGEIAQNEQFHLFPQCFLCNLYLKTFNPFPDNKLLALPNWKGLQMTISNLTKMEESYPNR